jgi:hypothetical protein
MSGVTRLSPPSAPAVEPGEVTAITGAKAQAAPVPLGPEKPAAEPGARRSEPDEGREGKHEQQWVVASHEVLFQPDDVVRCDVCGCPVANDEEADEGYAMTGSGAYLWARGDDVRVEAAPLCASCASAIGMTALGRWEIEEEEG